MPLTTDECLAAITEHSAGFAAAARANLSAPVEHCPEWSVADLVWHLTDVQWFWATIAEERLAAPPDESRRPGRASDDELVVAFEVGAKRLVSVLRAADQSASCWTWAPSQQDVAFITRHQVQEAAVHHWDAAHAAGATIRIDGAVAADSVEEFLTFSVSSAADPAEPARPALDGAIWFRQRLTPGHAPTLVVTDGAVPGTVVWHRVPDGVQPSALVRAAHLVGGPVDPDTLLLWLYGREPTLWDDHTARDSETDLLDRFRALTFTD